MGLDITAYRKLVAAPAAAISENGAPVDWRDHAWLRSIVATEKTWPGRTQGAQDGVFRFAEKISFRAGSYSGYNEWRDQLARLVGWGSAQQCWRALDRKEGPFYELINFSDCEGVIGPVVAAKLAADFSQFQHLATKTGGWFAEAYAKWRKAFEMAADGGAVDFH